MKLLRKELNLPDVSVGKFEKTNIGKIRPDKINDEIRRITRYENWCNLVEDPDSEDEVSVIQGRSNEARGTIIVRQHLHAT
jgi:hypothetical protein